MRDSLRFSNVSACHCSVGCCDSCLIQPIDSQEFQTLRRLPRSRWVLYAIRRKSHNPLRQSIRILARTSLVCTGYIDTMGSLERYPAAAVALAAALRRKFKGSLARSELGNTDQCFHSCLVQLA